MKTVCMSSSVSLLVCYLCTAFIEWELNPGSWHELSRFVAVGFWSLFSMVSISIYLENKA
jgi:hypothetical protein